MRLLVWLGVLASTALACGFQAPQIWAMLWQTPAQGFDRVFLSLVQNHYQEMQGMGQQFLAKTADPRFKAWAQTLLEEHGATLNEINTRLFALGGRDARAYATMKAEMSTDWKGFEAGTRQGKATEAYTGLMISNSFSAIGMAQQALERSKNPQVIALAKKMVALESKRVEKLQTLLIQSQ